MKTSWAVVLGGVACCTLPALAEASERRFGYSYGSEVMPEGARELELWSTARVGRTDPFTLFEERAELEFGLSERLQTSLYFNFSATRQGRGEQTGRFDGISSEWKYKLSDPVADVIGSAAYVELDFGPSRAGLEAKAIFDKRMGPVLLASNLIAEQEWEVESGDTNRELALEATAGAAYFLSDKLSVGLEARLPGTFVKGPTEDTNVAALYAGGVLSYAEKNWWASLTVMPQLAGLKRQPEAPPGLELIENEKVNVRLLFAFHL